MTGEYNSSIAYLLVRRMRTIASVLVLTLIALSGCKNVQPRLSEYGNKDSVLLYQTDMDWGGGTNQWRLAVQRLHDLPKWNFEKGDPPISQMKALKIARNYLSSKGVSGSCDVEEIVLRSVNPSSFPFHFYYRIRFGNVNAYLNHMTCIILMDGTVLKPERTE